MCIDVFVSDELSFEEKKKKGSDGSIQTRIERTSEVEGNAHTHKTRTDV